MDTPPSSGEYYDPVGTVPGTWRLLTTPSTTFTSTPSASRSCSSSPATCPSPPECTAIETEGCPREAGDHGREDPAGGKKPNAGGTGLRSRSSLLQQ
jgi:hypothetical protein